MTGTFAFPRNAFLGFDHIFDQLDNIHQHAKDTYPPHNVVKDEEMKYTLEMAVAGFKQEHIDIPFSNAIYTYPLLVLNPVPKIYKCPKL